MDTPPLHVITTQAMSLDPSDRLRLATELIDSVEEPEDTEWRDAWLRETEERRKQGGGVPWEDARAQILQKLAKR